MRGDSGYCAVVDRAPRKSEIARLRELAEGIKTRGLFTWVLSQNRRLLLAAAPMSAPVELATEPVRITILPSRKAGELAVSLKIDGSLWM